MVRALIVDDEPLARERLRSLLASRTDVAAVAECADGRGAVEAIVADKPDLVFLDIQMPEMDGFEVIAALGHNVPPVIFITAYDKYAVQAFDVAAVDYLLKPVNATRFSQAVDRAVSRIGDSRSARTTALHTAVEQVERERPKLTRFTVRHGSKLFFVRASDVDWIDGAANYVRLHVGGRTHLVRETLKGLEDRLDASFVRIHRSAIVRLDRIVSIAAVSHGEYDVVMRDGTRLTASRTHSARLREVLK